MTRYTLTAADLFIIMITLRESRVVAKYLSTTDEARERVMSKIEEAFYNKMTATFTVDDSEEDQ